MAKKIKPRARKSRKKVKVSAFNPHQFEKEILRKSKSNKKVGKKAVQKKTTMVVYVGLAERARRFGIQTGKLYEFKRGVDREPIPVRVDNLDLPALIQEKGKGCWRIEPSALFILKEEWEKECN